MNNNGLISFLQERLKLTLPGIKAHKQMAPLAMGKLFRSFKPNNNSKRSSVLVLITQTENDDEYAIFFTLRSSKLNSHSGQISFPGGSAEHGETPEETALRETYEETGIASEKITTLGRLSDLYVPPSNSTISPVIGYCPKLPLLNLNPDEVEESFLVPISNLINPETFKNEEWTIEGKNVTIPFWSVHPTTPLLGASAMILMELLEIINEFDKIQA